MGIMEREGLVTGVGCITPGVRREKVFQSHGEVVRWGTASRCILENGWS